METVEQLKKALLAEQNAHKETKGKLSEEEIAHNGTKEKLAAEEKSHAQTSESALAEIGELTNKLTLAAKEKGTGKSVQTVTIDGNDYKITINKFNWNGKDKTSQDIVADKAFAKELLEEGFGGLILISK